ncbi:hypothetical protein BsIDN1_43410 [Bacillus safensis]|uniref:Uncharacterized protein n=1 Tax=Bacillus safensis TaxID=561879 RepID=A0A5S9MC79_BACIA|nr:hypothetical protein BsIDN1_43410 [Bacillus safensis]
MICVKKELRLQTLAKLDQMSAEEFKRSTALLHERLFQLSAWKQADTIALTMSRGKEVPTMPLIEKKMAGGENSMCTHLFSGNKRDDVL